MIGAAGNFAEGDDHTDEERKMMFETRKILEDESIGIAVTCVRVPVHIGHSESVNVQTREPISRRAGARAARRRARRGRRGRADAAAIGRPRRGVRRAGSAATSRIRGRSACGSSSDNLRKGAATNAVQIAEVLIERGLLDRRAPVAA